MEQIQEVPIGDVKPYENNPRDNNGAVEATAKSIKEFGWQQPIVVDKDMVIIAGHTRLKAAKKLGLSKVPIVVADNLTEAQVKAYRLADNKVSETSIWDNKKLLQELEELDKLSEDVFTGFESSDYFEDVLDESDNEPIQENDSGVTYKLTFTTQNKEVLEQVQQYINEVGNFG